jgi:hypothetical protein
MVPPCREEKVSTQYAHGATDRAIVSLRPFGPWILLATYASHMIKKYRSFDLDQESRIRPQVIARSAAFFMERAATGDGEERVP